MKYGRGNYQIEKNELSNEQQACFGEGEESVCYF